MGRGVCVRIETSGTSLVGVIQDVQPSALSILVKQPLAERSAVSVDFGAASCEGEIVSCRRKEKEYEACIAISNREECDPRTANRFPVTQEVWICAGSLADRRDAVIADLSTRGIGLEMTDPLETGETVTVEGDFNVAFATVRYCRRLPDGRFHAGLDVFHIMPKEVEPHAHHPKAAEFGPPIASHE
ncbi:MAG TPA: hypothetical protein VEV17_19885 [Bryobacteraceae bacterium]|nr:hypothetical protein [Bryobacteraceae bacterium]